VLQRHAAKTGIRVGKNRYFFPSSAERFELGLGIEAWRGYFASVRPTYKQLMVNVNACMTAFYTPGNLAEAILAFNQRSKGGMPSKFAEKIKVTTKHLGYKRKKPIFAITTKSADKTFFDCQELGGKVSVEVRRHELISPYKSSSPYPHSNTSRKVCFYTLILWYQMISPHLYRVQHQLEVRENPSCSRYWQ
jgi:Argonaute linker 1 domain